MAETSWPFDAGAGSAVVEDGWAKMARVWARTGIFVPEWASGVGSLASGSFDGCRVTLGTGLQVVVGVGEAMVKGFYYANDTAKNLTVASNASGNPRIDVVVLELDRTNNQITAKIVQGTPAASPVAPAMTQAYNGIWQHVLAQYTVVNAATVPSSLLDLRTATPMPEGKDYCSTFKAGAQSVSAGVTTKLTWNNGINGNANYFNVANNWFVVPFFGWYDIEALVLHATGTATASTSELILNNSTTNIMARDDDTKHYSGWFATNPNTRRQLFPGDTVHVAFTPIGSAIAPDVASFFRIKYIPQGI